MTTSAIEPPGSQGSIWMMVAGGNDAPRRARRCALLQLDGRISDATAFEAELIVSELVSNSVRHAGVGADQLLTVELMPQDDRLRIVVTDPGSHSKPRMLPPDLETPGGFGLVLVDELCEAWGVEHDGVGPTWVWCDLLLDRPVPVGHAPQQSV